MLFGAVCYKLYLKKGHPFSTPSENAVNKRIIIAIRLKIQTKSSHKIHISELLRLDFVNLNSWIAISVVYISPAAGVITIIRNAPERSAQHSGA